MKIFFRIIATFFVFFGGQIALAEDDGSVGISIHPFLSDIVLEETDTEKSFTIDISNTSVSDVEFSVLAVDFGSLDESAGVAFLGADRDIEKSFKKADWIELETDRVVLQKGESKKITGKILNLPSLSPGGHYGSILFQSKGTIVDYGPTNVNIDERLSALVFIRKNGGAEFSLSLESFMAETNFFKAPKEASIILKNNGNIHLTPRGKVEWRDASGTLIRKGILNESSSILLPSTEKEYSVRMFDVEKPWIPGKYTLSMDIRYEGKNEFETITKEKFFIPFKSLALGVGILAVLTVLIRKRLQKRESYGGTIEN